MLTVSACVCTRVFVCVAESQLDHPSGAPAAVRLQPKVCCKSCSFVPSLFSVRVSDRKTGNGISHSLNSGVFFFTVWFLTCCSITGCLRQAWRASLCVASLLLFCNYFALPGINNQSTATSKESTLRKEFINTNYRQECGTYLALIYFHYKASRFKDSPQNCPL